MGVAALGGGAEPFLRRRPVPRHVMAAAQQRPEREHRAHMALARRLLEQRQRFGVVALAAAAVHQHLGERHLRIGHAEYWRPA